MTIYVGFTLTKEVLIGASLGLFETFWLIVGLTFILSLIVFVIPVTLVSNVLFMLVFFSVSAYGLGVPSECMPFDDNPDSPVAPSHQRLDYGNIHELDNPSREEYDNFLSNDRMAQNSGRYQGNDNLLRNDRDERLFRYNNRTRCPEPLTNNNPPGASRVNYLNSNGYLSSRNTTEPLINMNLSGNSTNTNITEPLRSTTESVSFSHSSESASSSSRTGFASLSDITLPGPEAGLVVSTSSTGRIAYEDGTVVYIPDPSMTMHVHADHDESVARYREITRYRPW